MQEHPKHTMAYEYYRDLERRSFRQVSERFKVSETSIKKWSKAFLWQRRIAAWDIAIKEGVQKAAIESIVDMRIKELEQTDRMLQEIQNVKPVLFTAIASCIFENEKTGKKELKKYIKPQNTQDMTAVCSALAKLNVTEVKIIEIARKLIGESDNVNLSATLKHELTASPKVLEASNELAKQLSEHV